MRKIAFASVRARGLKRVPLGGSSRENVFASVRARGLKQDPGLYFPAHLDVRVRTGAWIETTRSARSSNSTFVRVRTGAWIETLISSRLMPSTSVRVRTGAWIETSFRIECFLRFIAFASVRARGLKQQRDAQRGGSIALVRVRTGAWIETIANLVDYRERNVRVRTGAWIETMTRKRKTWPRWSSRPYGRVD